MWKHKSTGPKFLAVYLAIGAEELGTSPFKAVSSGDSIENEAANISQYRSYFSGRSGIKLIFQQLFSKYSLGRTSMVFEGIKNNNNNRM